MTKSEPKRLEIRSHVQNQPNQNVLTSRQPKQRNMQTSRKSRILSANTSRRMTGLEQRVEGLNTSNSRRGVLSHLGVEHKSEIGTRLKCEKEYFYHSFNNCKTLIKYKDRKKYKKRL